MTSREVQVSLPFCMEQHSGTLKTAAMVILITLVVVVLFIHSVTIRKPWLGTLFSSKHINPTAYALLFSQKWYDEGAINLKFASISEVRSIENDRTFPHRLYVSWPPGHLIPIHLIASITGKPPTVISIMKLNLLYHLFSSLILAMGAFYLLLHAGLRRVAAGLLSLIPAMIFLFTAGTLWFTQVVYQPVSVETPLFALYLFLEIQRRGIEENAPRRIVSVLQYVGSPE